MPQSEMTKLYKSVIDEVIKNVRNDFVNMGVDEQVLYDLQMLWEQKLLDYKVISHSEYFGNIHGGGANINNVNVLTNSMIQMGHQQQMAQQQHLLSSQVNDGGLNVLASGAVAAASVTPADNYGYIRPNNRTTYYHPSQGYFEASSTTAPTAANLPNVAPSAGNTGKNATNTTKSTGKPQTPNPRRFDGAGDTEEEDQHKQNPDDIIKLLYTNGEEEVILDRVKSQDNSPLLPQSSQVDNDEINSDLDDDDDEDDQTGDAEGYDESGGALDENVVLCQYEKVNRTRNKWRCIFKSGIIHVNGIDYVFSKANGEFEW